MKELGDKGRGKAAREKKTGEVRRKNKITECIKNKKKLEVFKYNQIENKNNKMLFHVT